MDGQTDGRRHIDNRQRSICAAPAATTVAAAAVAVAVSIVLVSDVYAGRVFLDHRPGPKRPSAARRAVLRIAREKLENT